MELRHEIISYS